MSALHQPHDALFKSFLGDIDIAKDLLHIHLPDKIKQQIDLSTLQIVSPAFVEPQLRQCFSDLVYSVKLKDSQDDVYIILEHLSSAPDLAHFQMLRYQTGVMQQHLDQGHKQLVTRSDCFGMLSRPPISVPRAYAINSLL